MRPGESNKSDPGDDSYLHISIVSTHTKVGDVQERVISFERRSDHGEQEFDNDLYIFTQDQIVDIMHIFFLRQVINFNVHLTFKFVIYIPSINEQLGRTITLGWSLDDILEMGYSGNGDGQFDDPDVYSIRYWLAKSFNRQLIKRVQEIIHLNEANKTAMMLNPANPELVSYINFTSDQVETFFASAPMDWFLINLKFLNVSFS